MRGRATDQVRLAGTSIIVGLVMTEKLEPSMDDRGSLPPPRSRTKPKFLWGGAVIFLAVVGMVFWAMGRSGSTAYFLKTSELVNSGPSLTEPVRVNGNVIAGTVIQNGLASTFDITDGETALTVTTDRPLPDSFRDDSKTEIVALGTYDGSEFTATEVLAKCPSKFKPKTS
jgi:cytochrome c-type biogenesis protein CcmE